MSEAQAVSPIVTASDWDPQKRILRTALKGPVSTADVAAWKDGLARAVGGISAGSDFGLLLDLVGYEPADLGAHKAMRTVIPELLASHGMRPAFLDLFEDAPEVPVSVENGIRCVAFANAHHDKDKMAGYTQRIGRNEQRFFTDVDEAYAWIQKFLE
ncbi:MAG TPA: hypothetical protein VHJ78_02705, partial [Actinomycetota bacterium]|nr:hypothetical protein [Actinomycetota bacterium]